MGQFQEKCGNLCSTNYIINLVSNGTWGLSLMTIIMTINLLVPWKRKGEGNYLEQTLPELGSAAGKAWENRLKTRTCPGACGRA